MNTRTLAVALGVGLVCSPGAFADAICSGNPPPCQAGSHAQCVPNYLQNPNGPGHWACEPNPIPPLPTPMTTFSQAWTQINNVVYEFVVDTASGHTTNGHVVMVFFSVGGNSTLGWIDLGAPPAGVATGPAATSVPGSGFIFVTVADKHGSICLNQGHDQSWTGWNC